MTAPIVRVDYKACAQIGTALDEAALQMRRAAGRLDMAILRLKAGGWEGDAAEALFRSMDHDVLPATARLHQALALAGATAREIVRVLQLAEEEAAAALRWREEVLDPNAATKPGLAAHNKDDGATYQVDPELPFILSPDGMIWTAQSPVEVIVQQNSQFSAELNAETVRRLYEALVARRDELVRALIARIEAEADAQAFLPAILQMLFRVNLHESQGRNDAFLIGLGIGIDAVRAAGIQNAPQLLQALRSGQLLKQIDGKATGIAIAFNGVIAIAESIGDNHPEYINWVEAAQSPVVDQLYQEFSQRHAEDIAEIDAINRLLGDLQPTVEHGSGAIISIHNADGTITFGINELRPGPPTIDEITSPPDARAVDGDTLHLIDQALHEDTE